MGELQPLGECVCVCESALNQQGEGAQKESGPVAATTEKKV